MLNSVYCYADWHYGEGANAEYHYGECHYAECNYGKCRYPVSRGTRDQARKAAHARWQNRRVYKAEIAATFFNLFLSAEFETRLDFNALF